MTERLFTVAEADAELAQLRELLPRLREARSDLIEASERISSRVRADGGGIAEPAWFEAQQSLKADLTWLAERGIMLRDPETGLVDFPAERDGDRIFLCWKLGEPSVGSSTARRHARPNAAVSRDLPSAVVLGASAQAPPPGIERASEVLNLRFAEGADELRAELPGARVLFVWRAERGELEAAWDGAADLRWIQTASAGVDRLLFPALSDSDVVVTNARGVFDDAMAEWVLGAMLAFTTGLHRSIVDQRAGVWGSDRQVERLEGSRLVVVGPGPIGRATGTRALALGMSVVMVGRTSRR